MSNSLPYIKTLSIIHLALIAGQVIFSAVCIGLIGKTGIILNPQGDVFFIIVPAFAVFGLFASSMIFKKFVESAATKPTLNEKLNNYRIACILRYALLEAPSLLGIVAYFLTGNLFYIFISGFIILFFFTVRPTNEKTIADLKLDYKQKEEFEQH
jgi:hypothetical protein